MQTAKARGESGFTLVELLVVMLVLGLLAAIAIPAFFNQRDKAKDSDAKAGARTAQTAIEIYRTQNNGSYVGADATELITIETALLAFDGNPADETSIAVPAAGDDVYEITATQPDTGSVFTIERFAGGEVVYSCTDPGDAGCPEGGDWG